MLKTKKAHPNGMGFALTKPTNINKLNMKTNFIFFLWVNSGSINLEV